jgi:hypothetical protein
MGGCGLHGSHPKPEHAVPHPFGQSVGDDGFGTLEQSRPGGFARSYVTCSVPQGVAPLVYVPGRIAEIPRSPKTYAELAPLGLWNVEVVELIWKRTGTVEALTLGACRKAFTQTSAWSPGPVRVPPPPEPPSSLHMAATLVDVVPLVEVAPLLVSPLVRVELPVAVLLAPPSWCVVDVVALLPQAEAAAATTSANPLGCRPPWRLRRALVIITYAYHVA